MICIRLGTVLLACIYLLSAEDASNASRLLCGLALAEQDLGRYAAAENMYLRSAALLAKSDPTLTYVLDDLATDYVDLRLYAKAQQAASRALVIALESLPSGDPQLARILGHLAVIAAHKGETARAEALFREALNTWANQIGPPAANGKRGAAATEANLGAFYISTGRYAEAWQRLDRARASFEDIGDAQNLAITLANLAIVCVREHRPEAATVLFSRALDVAAKVWGCDSPRTAAILAASAEALRACHRKKEAKRAAAQARAILDPYERDNGMNGRIDASDLARQPR